jgi:cytoskeletal protein CcmA (bactofilin family)
MFQKVIGQKSGETTTSTPSSAPSPTTAATSAPAAAYPSSLQPTAAVRPTGSAPRNVLSTDVEVKGTLKFTNDLIVDGRIEGEIQSDGNLTIGENARIKAEIRTATVTVHGKVHGNITANDRVDLKAGAEVVGDIKSKILTMEPGAIFVGKSTIGTPTTAPAGNAPAKDKA